MGELEIIRTSVDRPDISLHFLPIPPRTHTSLQCLYPLLDEAARDVIRTTPPLDNGGRVSNVDGLAFSALRSATLRLATLRLAMPMIHQASRSQ
jgi:hypothetical protein